MIGPRGYGWDACCVLNLLATGRAEEILASLGAPSYGVREVMEGEVLTLRPLPEDGPTDLLVPADLSACVASGALQPVDLSDEELATFTAFAAELDDGEARTAAMAVHRGLFLVTDDRVSLRVAREHAIPTLTTPDCVKRWSEVTAASTTALRDCLYRIEVRARYRPRRLHPLHDWWMASL